MIVKIELLRWWWPGILDDPPQRGQLTPGSQFFTSNELHQVNVQVDEDDNQSRRVPQRRLHLAKLDDTATE